MDRSRIIEQLAAHFKKNFNRITALELATNNSTGDTSVFKRKHVSYGTAGFRGRADQIAHLFYNVGLIAGLRCLTTGRANLGIMITASHNPIDDNGVKIIDSNGNMLESSWELIVEKFCNIPHSSIDQFDAVIQEVVRLMDQFQSLSESDLHPGVVMIGRDTRPSSETLVELIRLGLDAWAPLVMFKDYGRLTTPALHFLVGESTLQNFKILEIEEYYMKLADGLVACFDTAGDKARTLYDSSKLVVDNASGVGSLTMSCLCQNDKFKKCLPLSLINHIDDGGVLNSGCGADFVKSRHLAPRNADQLDRRYASLDGDADRVVYFYLTQDDQANQLHLLDGDKILALFALYLQDILQRYNLIGQLTLGVVQTAYANGASTDYLSRQLGLRVDFVDTGVKHLHKKALDYDLGVYFEANGHGTIWVSDRAKALIEDQKVLELRRLLSVLNNYTGDAISDILIVELILSHYDWHIQTWDNLYEDRPNTLTKVEIANRELVKTTDAGRTCLSPAGLQLKIDELVRQFGSNARSFVRASGTENVVRIYAESDSQEAANELAKLVSEQVLEMCNK